MKQTLFSIGILVLLVSVITVQYLIMKKERKELTALNGNMITVLEKAEQYITKDSLNAITVGELSLKLSEFNKYRSQESALINTLKTANRDLQSASTAQLQSIYSLKGYIQDSIRYIASTTKTGAIIQKADTVKCLSIKDKWFDLNGCIDNKNVFVGKLESRDSLLYVETIKRARFLGFLWKTNKVIDRKQDIISKNPNTKIVGAEYITIRK